MNSCLSSLKSCLLAFTGHWLTNHKYDPLAVVEQPVVDVLVGVCVHLHLSVRKLHYPSTQFQCLCCYWHDLSTSCAQTNCM